MADTSEIRFYLFDSDAFRMLLKERKPPLIAERKDGILSLGNEHFLFVSNERGEAIEFYVHEFAEFVLKGIILQELEAMNKFHQDFAIYKIFGAKFAHCLSEETEGNGQW